MKLTKTLEAEILKAYNEYWDAYLKGDMRIMAYWLHENVRMIGSGRGEFFENKKETLKYYRATAKQVAGKADMRNRKISVSAVDDNILVNEECDFFVLIKSTWTFYGEGRISTLFTKTIKGWKIIQEHGSMPDAQTSRGEQVNTNKIKAENIRLKDAVKRRTVELEDKNNELKIESSLERVRTVAMSMKKPEDMLVICNTISKQLALLGVKEIRNIQTAIFYEQRRTYMNYQYYAKHNKTFITDTVYTDHKVPKAFAAQMLKGKGKFYITHIKGRKKLKDWIAYQKSTNVFIDKYLYTASSLSYYWYSLGPVALGISTYLPLTVEDENLFKRFLSVFELAYRRYLDIEKAEAQAREAQIEGALEKVRSSSLAMHRSDEMQAVVNTVIDQLQKLNIVLDTTNILIFNNQEKFIEFWTGSNSTGAQLTTSWRVPYFNISYYKAIHQAHVKGKEIFTGSYSFKEKNILFKHLFTNTDFKNLNAERKKFILKSPRVTIVAAIAKDTAIQVISYTRESFSEDEIEILKRFSKVFNQAYTRFLDLQKAEVQAREAQIEAALEKVRSSSLAMHYSNELEQVVGSLFDRLMELGLSFDGTLIFTFEKEKRNIKLWIATNHLSAPTLIDLPYDEEIADNDIIKDLWSAIEKAEFILSKSYSGKTKNEYFRYTGKYNGSKIPASVKQIQQKTKRWALHCCAEKNSILGFDSWSEHQTKDEDFQILKRFAKVFDQAYVRFLDLQKAEAQTREAQIQLALERVRARSLAMHHTSELQDVVNILAQQLHNMGMDINGGVFIAINDEVGENFPLWASSGAADYIQKAVVPFFGKPIYTHLRDAIKKRNNFFEETYSKKEKDEMFKHLFRYAPWNSQPEKRKKELLSREGGLTRLAAISWHTCIAVTNHNGKMFLEEEKEILKRFGNVFEQSYIRFIDLQKAETQAREAQIEAALEKVRSSSLAMHRSEELKKIVKVVFEQLKNLNFAIDGGAYIGIPDRTDNTFNLWVGDDHAEYPSFFKLSWHDTAVVKDIWQVSTTNLDFLSKVYKKKEKNEWFRFAFKHTDFKTLPDKLKEWIIAQDYLTQTFALAKHSGIGIHFHHQRTITESEVDILKRFSKVFEQGYIRFLDLQKAETQAREAQIEAALERVRSRSMGMQKSKEMREVIEVIFNQLVHLGFEIDTMGFLVDFTDNNEYNAWGADANEILPEKMHVTFFDHPFNQDLVNQRKSTTELFTKTYSFEEKNSFWEAIFKTITGLPKEIKETLLQTRLNSPALALSRVLLKNAGIYLFNFSGKPYSDDQNAIILRFAKAFEQSYTRFLDLEKAEVQAREAQIEAALERVRSKAMAMHKSDDIAITASAAFEELKKLGIISIRCGVGLFSKDSKDAQVYAATQTGEGKIKTLIKNRRMDEHPALIKQFDSWENQEDHEQVLTGEELKSYYNKSFFQASGVKASSSYHNQSEYGYYFAFRDGLFYSWSVQPYTNNEKDILNRFRSIIALTFRRFLDLQKAETQARESQIQLALERVRARTMAMQKSDEFSEAVFILFNQFRELGENPDQATIGIINEKDWVIEYWVTMYGNQMDKVFKFSIDEPDVTNRIYKAWKEEKKSLVIDLSGKELYEFTHYRESMGGAKYNPDEKRRIFTVAFFSKGLLIVQSNETRTEESIGLLERFASVFEQTYTRFLDLKNAEAQAREAQIEAALERVRSKTMAMHNSEDVSAATATIFTELEKLGIENFRGGITIIKSDQTQEVWSVNNLAEGKTINAIGSFDMKRHPWWQKIFTAKQNKEDYHYYLMAGKDKDHYRDILNTTPKYLANPIKIFPDVHAQTYFFSEGGVWSMSLKPHTEKDNEIMKRFASVFNLTFRRYQDLQKAEAQARESQIQLALERVRARTMAMQKSDELREVVAVMYNQLEQLSFTNGACNITIMNENSGDVDWWMSGFGINKYPQSYHVTYFDHPAHIAQLSEWKSGKKFTTIDIEGDSKDEFDEVMLNQPDMKNMPEEAKGIIRSQDRVIFSMAFMKYGALVWATNPITEEQANILQRFAKVFEQTYTRFLDLQKAEGQAREAEIELGLERVRSRAMAMQSSEEVNELIGTVFTELTKLDLLLTRCIIWVFEPATNAARWWMANIEEPSNPMNFYIKYHEHPAYLTFVKEWKIQNVKFVYDLKGQDKINWDDILFNETELKNLPDVVKNGMQAPERVLLSASFNNFGGLNVASLEPLSEEHFNILLRFAKVFDLTYTRFLDLQKAESQAREAKIEAAMEKVRSRTMAMHKSDELVEVIQVVFEQLQHLNYNIDTASFSLNYKDFPFNVWMAAPNQPYPAQIEIPAADISVMNRIKQVIAEGHDFFATTFNHEEKNQWLLHVFEHTIIKHALPERKKFMLDAAGISLSIALVKHIALIIGNYAAIPYTEEENDILKRFAKVFEQTYTRFLDLQKAEAQAREAKIEAAMEKVRARAMAMQKPNELIDVAQLLRKEMGLLGVEELETSSIYIHNETTGNTECWYAIKNEEKLVSDHMTIDLKDTWVGREMYDFYHSDKNQISIVMQGANRKEWINYCSEKSKALTGFYGEEIPERTYHLYKFSGGYMGAASPGNISAESWDLLKRATNVFSLAYTRFNDLQVAEANAKEAIRQAALDRIRADIASMRTTKDLERITPLIWNELTILGISFIRCGVFIMDDKIQLIHTFLSTPDGKAIAAFHLPYNTSGNISLVLQNWREKKNYIDHWDEKIFTDFAHSLVQQGALSSIEQYMKTLPKGGFYLHFLPFLQGMLYVGNTTQLSDEEINLLQSVADAFATAYARYEDFNKLEAAKKQVDSTLTELQSTQKQLIQSEKMASLGELTAGIAHEIQNPLNFVNNFSEVNSELISELVDEVDKGNTEEVKALANDIKENSEKINHHGKRAGDIVRGMLQHSRTSTGQKELTDINALCDEYLRLAYHGLRAKDKSFNAKFETDFDPSLPKINVVPQDIGRVVLNLINNAFYAVSEKQKAESEMQNAGTKKYEPTVTISTKDLNGMAEIIVRDNGNGIPQKVLDKIFQPFFTTKPTGQGTGLGLSLSYDIVKAHGGEIKVNTKENEGTEFIIVLPIN